MFFRNDRIFLYMAMADAFALGAEFLKKSNPFYAEVIKTIGSFEQYVSHPELNQSAGTYSDDTEMSLAIADVLIEKNFPYSRLDFAEAFVRQFNIGGKRKGYSQFMWNFLNKVQNGREFLDQIKPFSFKNGAAMRAVPLGVLPTVQEVLHAATTQAEVTHDNAEGTFSSRIVALLSHFALYSPLDFRFLSSYCMAYLPKQDEKFLLQISKPWPYNKPVIADGNTLAINTVHAVMDLLKTQSSLLKMLEKIIEIGGDTDTVATICWGIASARMQNEILPEFMLRDLEQGNDITGKDYLLKIGKKLMDKYCK